MSNHRKIVWLHDKALKKNDLLLQYLYADVPKIFIWDEEYFDERQYSLKRLVFIYETLCEMGVRVIKAANTLEALKELNVEKIITYPTADSHVARIIKSLQQHYEVDILQTEPFVQIPKSHEFKRFFSYWNKAQKTAFLTDGRHESMSPQ